MFHIDLHVLCHVAIRTCLILAIAFVFYTVDFRVEFGRLWEEDMMRIILADELSPDNCRLWDVKSGEKMDSDRFDRDLGNVEEGYQEVARRLGILPESGPSKRIVHHWFAEQGIRPRVYASVAGNEAIVSMVALGCGLGIVPQVVLDYSTIGQKVNRIKLDAIEPYQLGLCCLKKRSKEPAIQALFNC